MNEAQERAQRVNARAEASLRQQLAAQMITIAQQAAEIDELRAELAEARREARAAGNELVGMDEELKAAKG